MHTTFSATILSVTLLAIGAVGCSSGPPQAENGQTVRGQIDDRENLEEAFELYLLTTEISPKVFNSGVEAMGREMDRKADQQHTLNARLQNYAMSFSEGSPEHNWALLRRAQLYLNFGCELNDVEAPSDLSRDQVLQFRLSMMDLVAPLLVRAEQLVERIEGESDSTTEGAVEALSQVFLQESNPDKICQATRVYWAVGGV